MKHDRKNKTPHPRRHSYSCWLCNPHKFQGNSREALSAQTKRATQDGPDEVREEGRHTLIEIGYERERPYDTPWSDVA